MPIRISRACVWPAAAALLLLGACGPSAGVRPGGGAGPADPEALLADADAALERGDLPVAAAAYRSAAEASGDEAVAEQATRVAYDNFQLQQAALAAERWLALNPTSEEAHRYAGMAALRLHRLDKAETEFAQLVDTAYISPAAGFLALLPVIGDEGLPTDVTDLFRRLVVRHPQVAEAHYALGNAALRAENFGLAASEAQRAVQLAPFWTPARMLLARATIASGKEEEGLAVARDLVMAPESDVATHIEYALLLASTGRDEEARAMLTPYATGQTVIPGAVRSLGALDLETGALDAANGHFEDLLSTGAQSYEALYFLGVVAERRNDAERALRYYTRVVGGDYALAAQQRVARIKAEQSGLDAGLLHLEEYGRTQPHSGPDVVAARAALASAFKDDKRALDILNAGLLQYPDSLDLRMSRVFLFERIDKVEYALRDLRALLRERPGDVSVQNALGYTLADHDKQLDEAHSLVAAALVQSPDSAAVLDSMGWVLHRQGKDAEALGYLRRAQALGNDPEIELHLGEVQWALGDQAGARKTWQQALERRPDDAELQERLKRAGD
jgi:tetratricopeptide (TPR) repeat protein